MTVLVHAAYSTRMHEPAAFFSRVRRIAETIACQAELAPGAVRGCIEAIERAAAVVPQARAMTSQVVAVFISSGTRG